MSSFDERKDAFENKFVHDNHLRFKIEASRNKSLGAWAASLLGLNHSDAEEYIKQVVRADFEEAGDEDVFRKLISDLGNIITEEELRKKMAELLDEAKAKYR